MAINQKPDALSMLGNMKKFIVSSGSQISFELKEGSTVLLAATYEPGTDGKATIDVKDIIESRLRYNIQHTAMYEQTEIAKTFTAVIDGAPSSFKVIRAGVANLADTPSNWLRGNFLTWQPQNKKVTYHSPEWLTYYAQEACSLKLKAYFPDNTVQNINLGACEAGKAFTFNLQYALIAGTLGQNYPTHYEVWAENLSGTRLTYIQRYLYSDPLSELEQWFLFENSLGGLDTLRAYGDSDFTGNHEHKLSSVDDVLSEYDIDTERLYNKNTGFLDEYERKWLLDYFPAKRKYIYHSASIRSIVLKDSDVKYSASDLPSSYNFNYKFSDAESSVLLNLIRDENIPASITIPNLDAPDFHLPPRLSEYPRVPLHEGVILPAFDPHSEDPKVTTVGAILAAAVAKVLESIEAGEGGGELVNILRVDSPSDPSDFNVFSAARTLLEIAKVIQDNGSEYFLSKVNPDTAQGLITFLSGLETGEFIPGMFGGKGAKIDENGNIEAESLRLRAFLEAPEYRLNRISIIGDEAIYTPGAVIESVEQTADRIYTVGVKLEEGDSIPYSPGTLLKGIFHEGFSFSTSCLRVESVEGKFMSVVLVADTDTPSGYNLPPKQFMTVARVGHVSDSTLQSYTVFSTRLGGFQFYDGCSDFLNGRLVGSFDTAQTFKSLYTDLPLKDGSPYLYTSGLVTQDIIRVDYQGKVIRTINDKGLWQEGTTYYNNDENGTDVVWYQGVRWRCFSYSTTTKPVTGPYWVAELDLKDEFLTESENMLSEWANNFKVGGKNLLRDSEFKLGTSYWVAGFELIDIDTNSFEGVPFLNVTPTEITWVYPDHVSEIEVKSNTNWIIE